ncbi:MAG: hypothetical protein H6541_14040 [Lentimicrobiaceae bacterium]|nr:hypothetical protein [Lentimicrobiaceae bacterium]MCB9024609.1 hypothetical protein [Lentimicrobiaceae bacterium]
MDWQRIEELLNKYLDGESTLEEEGLLKEYFSRPDVAEEHLIFKAMFSHFTEAGADTTPSFDVAKELNALIEHKWRDETENRNRRIFKWLGSVAAVLVLVLGLFQLIDKPEVKVKDTFDNPHLAYLETKKALLKVSRAMNSSSSKLKYLSKVDESFDHLHRITEIDKVVNSVKNK